jgi:hypothetical protein
VAVIATGMKRHRNIEWLSLLRQIDRETPKDRELHLICDNYATHKHPKVQRWLEKHPRLFRDLSEKRLKRSPFGSVPELIAAIEDHIAAHNKNPKPFVWTAQARDILQKVIRANARLSSKQNEALH